MRINDDDKSVKFTEMLVENSAGLSSGVLDSDMSSGFGFKTESYNTFGGAREGNIEEQSNLFGKNYSYNFDYKEIRSKVEQETSNQGYTFQYQITPIGL